MQLCKSIHKDKQPERAGPCWKMVLFFLKFLLWTFRVLPLVLHLLTADNALHKPSFHRLYLTLKDPFSSIVGRTLLVQPTWQNGHDLSSCSWSRNISLDPFSIVDVHSCWKSNMSVSLQSQSGFIQQLSLPTKHQERRSPFAHQLPSDSSEAWL